MSHITCHECGGNDHTTGYGLGVGPMGAYTICDCGVLLEFSPDVEGLADDEIARITANVDKWRAEVNEKRQAKGLPLI